VLLALILATIAHAPSNQPVAPFRIAGNLYYVGANEVTSFLITTPKGHIVIDGGFAETAPQIRANIERLGFRIEDVKILLNSHAHYDHAGGLAQLKQWSHATLYATRGDIPLLARGGHDDPQFGDRFTFPPVEADRILEDGQRVSLGGTTLTAHITPGHTPGCTTWTTRIGRYDVVFVGSPSIPSDYHLTPELVAQYRRTFAFLESLHPDIFLGAHGSFFDLDAKRQSHDFRDHGEYAKFVAAMKAAFERRAASHEDAGQMACAATSHASA
jgi:metallo-beta-lactamase class B